MTETRIEWTVEDVAARFAEAAETYVVLSVGDGLVAQIPALLLSIATAVIVTRSTTSSDMGAMIGKQLNIQRAWIPVAAVLAIIGVVPGNWPT